MDDFLEPIPNEISIDKHLYKYLLWNKIISLSEEIFDKLLQHSEIQVCEIDSDNEFCIEDTIDGDYRIKVRGELVYTSTRSLTSITSIKEDVMSIVELGINLQPMLRLSDVDIYVFDHYNYLFVEEGQQ